ncbi:hypothetical protein VNI00_005168 [Paramarasmius palmivorus]|uniref:Uncharacterized protein n=1 Tax=Paramarasmius palmivorus TaxID=297713 RepID=A0AAW0DEP7_9AGAR
MVQHTEHDLVHGVKLEPEQAEMGFGLGQSREPNVSSTFDNDISQGLASLSLTENQAMLDNLNAPNGSMHIVPQPPIGTSPAGQMDTSLRRTITVSDLQERSKFMSQNIQNIEHQMHNLASARAAMTDQLFTQKMRTLQLEITQRKEGLAKINQLIHKMISSGETSMTLPRPRSPPRGPSWEVNRSMPATSSYAPLPNALAFDHSTPGLPFNPLASPVPPLSKESSKVQQKDLWPIIAGRLGCVQFPGEPPKSGPAAANQLAHVYREYLMEFDRIYMNSFVDQRRKNMMFAQHMAHNPIFTKFTAPQIKTLVECSDKSVHEMRMDNMPEELIRAVEEHRQQLQVLAREQSLFRTMLTMKQGDGIMPMIPPVMAVKPPFCGPPQNPNISRAMAPGPSFIPGNTAPLGPHPTPLQQALLDVHTMRQDYLQRCIPNLQTVDVPAEQRLEYNSLLEQVHSRATAMEQKLSYLHLVGKSEQNTRLVISKVINVQHQRTMIGYSNPRFIMTLDDLRKANQVIQTALDFVSNVFKT